MSSTAMPCAFGFASSVTLLPLISTVLVGVSAASWLDSAISGASKVLAKDGSAGLVTGTLRFGTWVAVAPPFRFQLPMLLL